MKCSTTASTASATALKRINSLEQFDYARVLGIKVFGHQVPVFYSMIVGEEGEEELLRGPVYYNGTRYHKCFMYDENRHDLECTLLLTFYVDYYKKCYLNGTLGTNDQVTHPYTEHRILKRNTTVSDSFGKKMGITRKRTFFNGNIMYRAKKTTQTCANCDESYPKAQSTQEVMPVVQYQQYKKKHKSSSTCSSCGAK